jgi:superfamily II DNA or RNA helicase
VAAFALKGGTLRLICSPDLTEDDHQAIRTGYELRAKLDEALRRSIAAILQHPQNRPALEFLATLVAFECLEIRIAFRPGALGIFHDKIGIFRDLCDHTISFTGSSNETMQAWDPLGNHESFDVFRSWTNEGERVKEHAEYFGRLWSGNETGVQTASFPDAVRNYLISVSNPGGIEAAARTLTGLRSKPKREPQIHQVRAVESWKAQGMRGILQHATGSGKTLTALVAAREWLAGGRPVMILVPSEILIRQWRTEIREVLGDIEVKTLVVGAGHETWQKEHVVEGFTAPFGPPRITLATIQTASSEHFFKRVQAGEHLFLIIDEVHRVGSPKFSRVLDIVAGARLGLSATPYRFGDADGTSKILTYFGTIIAPEFTVADAIAAGRLCPYSYHVHLLALSESEMDEWRRFTHEINLKIARLPDTEREGKLPDDILLLLVKRADILKKASGKPSLAVDVLKENYEAGDRWLVYCDDQEQLRQVIFELRSARFMADEYHSAMPGDEEATLEYFSEMGGILVAIRCLDEGVDIPNADHALILASSRNPREFIQRRGRILRTSPGKTFAEIHDALVVPPTGDRDADSLPILRAEIARALHFALGARNDAVKFQLRQLARDMGIASDGSMAGIGFDAEEAVE